MHTLSRVIGVLPDRATSLQLRRRATRRTYSCVAVLRDAQTSGAVLIAGEIPGAPSSESSCPARSTPLWCAERVRSDSFRVSSNAGWGEQ